MTGAKKSVGHVLTGASVHARVGLALIVVDVAVLADPAWFAQTFVAKNRKKTRLKVWIFEDFCLLLGEMTSTARSFDRFDFVICFSRVLTR